VRVVREKPRSRQLLEAAAWRTLGTALALVLTLELLGADADQAPLLGGVRQSDPVSSPQPGRIETVMGENEAPAHAGASSAPLRLKSINRPSNQ